MTKDQAVVLAQFIIDNLEAYAYTQSVDFQDFDTETIQTVIRQTLEGYEVKENKT